MKHIEMEKGSSLPWSLQNVKLRLKKITTGIIGNIFRILMPTNVFSSKNPRKAELVQNAYRPEQREKNMRELEVKKSRIIMLFHRFPPY